MKRREFLWKSTALVGLGAEPGNTSLALKGVQITRGSSGKEAANLPEEERLGWFREAKFGMMIHWGLYSVLGGEWRGKQLPLPGEEQGQFYMEDNVEMIMEPFRIPLAEYREIGKQFN
ncbi:MAG: alpha-L-fucosidase, partial [Acidobacteriaceae bacterium]